MSRIIEILKTQISTKKDLVDDFFAQKFAQNPAIFYNSVDLRHSGFKIAPVDTNCFPAGFNNISGISKIKAQKVAAEFLEKNFAQHQSLKIMIIPENHTRNLRYLENLASLQEILQNSKTSVIIGSLIADLKEKTELDLENGQKITLHPITRNGTKIQTIDNFTPDLIILNNDLTSGAPEILKNLDIPITPATNLGWYNRSKSGHFTIYNELASELSQILEIDPWLISSMHRMCNKVDFKNHVGFECLANHVDDLIAKLKEKYREYDIKDEPYCYIKADSGTYGMAIMTAFSGAEILDINKKERNKMNMLKESTQNTAVMIQEGIQTIDKINDMSAEPMIYMINGEVVGNLFRANANRNQQNSLNSAGASFFDLENLPQDQLCLGCKKDNMKMIYSTISRLAALSSSIEIKHL